MRIWDLLFLLLIAALPVQLGKIIFLRDSFVLGIPIDYLALTLYFSDIILLLFIAAALLLGRISLIFNKTYLYTCLLFSLYLFVSAWFSQNTQITGTIFAINILALSVFSVLSVPFFQMEKLKKGVIWVFNFGIIWQSLLLIFEFALQHSLGLWVLGERSFDSTTVSIAHSQVLGIQFLRPYGTFPHPNVAAAFILTSIIILLALSTKKPISVGQKIVFLLATVGILLTFSKTALFILVLVFLTANRSLKLKGAAISCVILIAIFLILNPEIIPIPSVAERLLLIQSALDISLKNALFGVGTTNFIRDLATLNLFSLAQTRLLQPVHNIFLLILSENGIVGLIFFAAILYQVSQKITDKFRLLLFLVILIYGSIDHFYWTLHQGQLLLWLSLGFILSSKTSKAKDQ